MGMAIMAPCNTVAEIGNLAEAGASELYCGVVEDEWLARYGTVGINRRVELFSNFRNFSDLRKAADAAHACGVRLHLTLNEHYYTNAQYPYLMDYVARATDAGIDALIVADPALILALAAREPHVSIHLSTGGAVFNSSAARFFGEIGVERITFPRHLKLEEIRKIIAGAGDLETSVFIMNSRCANIDGLCTFDHSPLRCPDPLRFLGEEAFQGYPDEVRSKDIFATGSCMLPYRIQVEESPSKATSTEVEQATARQALWSRHHIDNLPCGACALFEFHEMGVTSVKIVGRGNVPRRKVGDIGFLKMLIVLLERGETGREEFRQIARDLYQANYGASCRSLNCYYPEMLP